MKSLEERRRVNEEWIALLRAEASKLFRDAGGEAKARHAAMVLAELAVGDAKGALFIANQVLNDAREAYGNPELPRVDFGRIDTPDFMRQQDCAIVIQDYSRQAAARILEKRTSRWRRVWGRVQRLWTTP